MIKRAPFVHTKGASFIIRGRKSNAPLQRRDAPKARPVKTGSLTETAGFALLKRLWERSGIAPLSACGSPFLCAPLRGARRCFGAHFHLSAVTSRQPACGGVFFSRAALGTPSCRFSMSRNLIARNLLPDPDRPLIPLRPFCTSAESRRTWNENPK